MYQSPVVPNMYATVSIGDTNWCTYWKKRFKVCILNVGGMEGLCTHFTVSYSASFMKYQHNNKDCRQKSELGRVNGRTGLWTYSVHLPWTSSCAVLIHHTKMYTNPIPLPVVYIHTFDTCSKLYIHTFDICSKLQVKTRKLWNSKTTLKQYLGIF